MRRKGARTNYPRLCGASSAARRSGPFGQFWGDFATFAEHCGDGRGACGDGVLKYRRPCWLRNGAVHRGTRAGESCNEHPEFCVTRLPANRAQSDAGPKPSFRRRTAAEPFRQRAHHHPRRADRDRATCRLRRANQPEGSSIHRMWRARKNHPTSGFGAESTTGKRLEAGAGQSGGPIEGPSPSKELRRRWGSATALGGSRTSDGSD